MSLIEMIYVSTATHALVDQELRQILDSSVRNNSPHHITGMLLYSAGSFMQALEGAEADVDESMARIEKGLAPLPTIADGHGRAMHDIAHP
jgi:hypothetical protein